MSTEFVLTTSTSEWPSELSIHEHLHHGYDTAAYSVAYSQEEHNKQLEARIQLPVVFELARSSQEEGSGGGLPVAAAVAEASCIPVISGGPADHWMFVPNNKQSGG